MRRFVAASPTATNVHGWRFAPDGADAAVRTASSISSRGTGPAEKWRTLRRVSIASWNARARRSISSGPRRANGNGTKRGSFTVFSRDHVAWGGPPNKIGEDVSPGLHGTANVTTE